MELIFVTEARFHRGADGKIYSVDAFTRQMWDRYLTRFEKITVVARVLDTPDSSYRENMCSESERVSFLPLPHYLGMYGFLKKRKAIETAMKNAFTPGRIYILRVPGILGSLAARILERKSIPYGVEVVGDPWDVFAPKVIRHPFRPLLRRFFTQALKRTVRKSSAALYVTQQTLQRRYPVSDGVFQTAASNVQIDDATIAPEPKFLVSGRCVELISIGSLAQMYKAPDVVLKALAQLKKRNFDYRFTWLGDGKYKSAMQELASRSGISDRVDFRGNVPPAEARKALLRSDIFLLASRTEGLPRVIIEAMSCGLPCISTRVGGIPELLDDQVLIDADRPDQLACRLAEMMNNPAFAAKQAERNLQESHRYKNSVLMRNRISFYERLIQISE